MLTTNYIEFFFHIKEEYITGRYQTDEGLVYEVQLPVTTRTCPYCGLQKSVQGVGKGAYFGLYRQMTGLG